MLQAIRDRASGWIAYIIVILICIPFALWGIHEYFGGNDPLLAAEVNGREIPLRLLNQEFQQQKRYYQSIMGKQLPQGYEDKNLKESALANLVRDELLRQEVEKAGYLLNDQVLLSQIKEIPAFFSNGVFDKNRYEEILEMQRRSTTEFEHNLRQQILVSQFIEGLSQSAFIPEESIYDYRRLVNQQRKFTYFIVPIDLAKATAEVGDEAIEKYYKTHTNQFNTPQRVQLDYIELTEKSLIASIPATEQQLREHYQSRPDSYQNPEQRRARHILLKLPSSTTATKNQSDKQVEKHAQELVVRLRSGEKFSDLAKEYSEDTLSASSGGDLGWIVHGDMDHEFEDTLFNLERNQVSDPIKTESGYHIIQLVDIKPANRKSFNEVRGQIEKEYKQHIAEEQLIDLTEQLITLSYEQPDSLEPVAETLGIPINHTSWITENGGPNIGIEAKVRQAAFSKEVLSQGRNSELIELSNGRVVVLRVAQHEPAKPKPLHVVRDEIKAILAKEKARNQSIKAGQEAIHLLQTESAPVSIAQKFGAQLVKPGFVKRDDKKIQAPILRKAFTLIKQEPNKFSPSGIQLPNGDYVVIWLNEVQEKNRKNSVNEGIIDEQQASSYGTRELDGTYRAMELNADIRVLRENI